MEHHQLINQTVIIIGGGLSGLTLAYLLSKKDIHPLILEASGRLGGRIHTVKGVKETPLELGATWFSDQHSNLSQMVDELGLKKYPQFSRGKSLFQTKSFEPSQEFVVPESESPSYRIGGGTQMIINALADRIGDSQVEINARVVSITQTGKGLMVHLKDGRAVIGEKVVVCLPPQLAFGSIDFVPSFPKNIADLLPKVQTWMAGSIKFAIEYETPFWRAGGYSGMLFSHSGIVTEMYDHTNVQQTKYGLTGFLNGAAASYTQGIRREYVLKQLSELLGEQASIPLAYFDKVWTDEYLLGGSQVIHRPHQNNGHPLLQESFMDNHLLFANTETSPEYGGYMEGAMISAINADRWLA